MMQTILLLHSDWGSTGSSVSEVITVNSIVITASVYSSNCSLNNTRFTEPVRITLHHVNANLDDPTCSFLDPANDRYNKKALVETHLLCY